MKFKLISVTIILSMLTALTACGNESSLPDSTPSDATNSSAPISQGSTIDPASSDVSSAVPQVNNWEDYVGPDGQPVTLADATVDADGRVTFDYSFIKYAPQIYDDSLKNPGLINWETFEFAPYNGTYTPAIKRVKAGDVLENGLKVAKAYETLEFGTYVDEATLETRSGWDVYYGELSFDGELTLSGAMYCVPEDDYMTFEGELYFFPDTTSFSQLPVGCGFASSENKEYTLLESVFPDAKLAVVSGTMFYLGNISETDCGGVIEKGGAAEVTVTVKNIRMTSRSANYGGRGGGCFADIVSVEKIN